MDPAKIIAVLKWPTPKSIKGGLGLTGYYRRFIKSYGKIAALLTRLLKKENESQFVWTEQAQDAFQKLQNVITTAPVLILPDFSIPFQVECDASGYGMGTVLMQNGQPVVFFGKAISERNSMKSTYEKELKALVHAVLHWRTYLLGRKFVVRKNHRSLRQLLQQNITSPSQQYWVSKLLGFDFEIEYKGLRTQQRTPYLEEMENSNVLLYLSLDGWIGID